MGRKRGQQQQQKGGGRIAGTIQFARDVRGELRRVNWPNRDQLQQSTAVVLIIVVTLGAFVWLWDTVFQFLARLVFLQ